jgi:hypothetical protein
MPDMIIWIKWWWVGRSGDERVLELQKLVLAPSSAAAKLASSGTQLGDRAATSIGDTRHQR